MSSASSRAAYLSVVQRGLVSIRRFFRHVRASIAQLCLAVFRAAITGAVFTSFAMLMLYYLGFPVPGTTWLLDKFEAIGRLADILS